MGANRPWLFALFFTGSPINQCLSLHSTRFSCRACCSLFPFISNDSQSIPATPCNMDATWPGQDFAVCRLTLGALPGGDVGLPPKRTCTAQTGMSAFGQKRTWQRKTKVGASAYSKTLFTRRAAFSKPARANHSFAYSRICFGMNDLRSSRTYTSFGWRCCQKMYPAVRMNN